jgi:hypothetical protein
MGLVVDKLVICRGLVSSRKGRVLQLGMGLALFHSESATSMFEHYVKLMPR